MLFCRRILTMRQAANDIGVAKTAATASFAIETVDMPLLSGKVVDLIL